MPLLLSSDWILLIKCGYSLGWDRGALLCFGVDLFWENIFFLETFWIRFSIFLDRRRVVMIFRHRQTLFGDLQTCLGSDDLQGVPTDLLGV